MRSDKQVEARVLSSSPKALGGKAKQQRQPLGPKKKSQKAAASKLQPKSGDDVETLRARVTYLEAENGKLIAEKQAMAKRMEEVKRSIEDKLKEIQRGIGERMDRGESKSSIMEYVKAGFGTMLGVLAALIVVNLAIGAFDAVTSDSSPSNDASSGANDSGGNNASSTTAEDGDGDVGNSGGDMMMDDSLFSMFGGKIITPVKMGKTTASRVTNRRSSNKKTNKKKNAAAKQ
jgi:hypothetical protein